MPVGISDVPPTMRAMKRRSYGRDAGLTLRMFFTSGLLGLLYVAFAAILISLLLVALSLVVLVAMRDRIFAR